MKLKKEILQRIHHAAYELAFNGVNKLDAQFKINEMPLHHRIQALEEIMAGFFEGVDIERPKEKIAKERPE